MMKNSRHQVTQYLSCLLTVSLFFGTSEGGQAHQDRNFTIPLEPKARWCSHLQSH